MSRKQIVFWSVLIGALALDQAVKAWIRGALPPNGSFGGKPFPGIFELTLTYNHGVAFSLFDGKGVLLTPIAVIMAAGAIWYSLKNQKEPLLTHLSMSLLAAGALGNVYDRLVAHQVTDMFWFRLINFPVFNVADACITFAVGLMMIVWWGPSAQKSSKVAEA